jgi:hypothetical protein
MGGGLRLKGLLHDGDVRVVFSFVLLVIKSAFLRGSRNIPSRATILVIIISSRRRRRDRPAPPQQIWPGGWFR